MRKRKKTTKIYGEKNKKYKKRMKKSKKIQNSTKIVHLLHHIHVQTGTYSTWQRKQHIFLTQLLL